MARSPNLRGSKGGVSSAEWTCFYGRYTPFEMRSDERVFVFASSGSTVVFLAWQQAIERWAALRWSELRAGRSGAAHGRAMAHAASGLPEAWPIR